MTAAATATAAAAAMTAVIVALHPISAELGELVKVRVEGVGFSGNESNRSAD